MNKISLKKLDLDIYEEVLDNGLRVYLCNIPRHTIHARMTTLFGGSILEFKLEGEDEFTKVPAGVAHFLEHKLFEKKDYDPTLIYDKNGAMCNAFTNPFITSYYFNGAGKFYENLNNLLRCVHEPYFTDENVLKEKGIISQEKKADLDNSYSIVHDRSLLNTFKNLDYRNTVLGSLDDINSITKEDLYSCYNTFYHPSNMILTICGEIDIDETISFIKKYYDEHDFGHQKKIIIKEKNEPTKVVKKEEIIYKDIQNKEVQVNYKVKVPHRFKNEYLEKLYFSLMLDMNFGGLSDISDIANRDKNFLSGIASRIVEVDDFYVISFNVIVKDDTDKAITLIDETLKDFDYNEETFDLIKKAILNSLVISSEDTSEVCSNIVNQVRLYGKIVDNLYEFVSDLDFNTLKEYTSHVDLSNRSVVILEAKKTS